MNQLLTDHSASRAAQLRNNLLRNCPGVTFSRRKNKHVAEYALRGSLPTIEEIEAELAGDLPPESPKQGGSHD